METGVLHRHVTMSPDTEIHLEAGTFPEWGWDSKQGFPRLREILYKAGEVNNEGLHLA